MIARMWEARVSVGRVDEAAAWVSETLLPAARAAGALAVEGFRAGPPEERVVAITRWAPGAEWTEPSAPDGLLLRAHAWDFEELSESS